MKKFEYLKIETTAICNLQTEKDLNAFGDQGWELCSAGYEGEGISRYFVTYFKREKAGETGIARNPDSFKRSP